MAVGDMPRKVHYCLFCGIAVTQIPRHVKKFCKKAQKSQDVKDLLNQNVDKARKSRILTKLKREGDYQHNLTGKIFVQILATWHSPRQLQKLFIGLNFSPVVLRKKMLKVQ